MSTAKQISDAYERGYREATHDANISIGTLLTALAYMNGGDVTIPLDVLRTLGTNPKVDIMPNDNDGSVRITVTL
jgi:hypothetical protein